MTRWTSQALSDVVAIEEYIAHDSPRAADAWCRRIRDRARRAAKLPRAGRVVPEFGRDDVREVLVKSYRIVYRIDPQGIVVLTVFESHKALRSLGK